MQVRIPATGTFPGQDRGGDSQKKALIKRGAVGTIKEEYRKENAMDAKGMFKSRNDTVEAIRC